MKNNYSFIIFMYSTCILTIEISLNLLLSSKCIKVLSQNLQLRLFIYSEDLVFQESANYSCHNSLNRSKRINWKIKSTEFPSQNRTRIKMHNLNGGTNWSRIFRSHSYNVVLWKYVKVFKSLKKMGNIILYNVNCFQTKVWYISEPHTSCKGTRARKKWCI